MSYDLTPADMAAMTNSNNMSELWSNPFIYLIWLAVLGNGNGGLFGGNRADANGALTRAEMYEGFNNQDVNAQLRGISTGICDGFYAVNTGLKDGFYGIQAGLAENRFASQQCCCETNRNIDAVRYENAQNTCAITNAIHAEGEITRALINQNTVQDLRDRLEAKDRDLMAANYQLSQLSQTQTILNALRVPCCA
jgi:hypothetical protein